MKVKGESEKVGWKLNIQKTKIMASGPITSWQIEGKTMETVTDFILGSSKITSGGDCSHEIKRHLLLGRKAMTNLESIHLLLYLLIHLLLELLKWCTEMHSVNVKKKKKHNDHNCQMNREIVWREIWLQIRIISKFRNMCNIWIEIFSSIFTLIIWSSTINNEDIYNKTLSLWFRW